MEIETPVTLTDEQRNKWFRVKYRVRIGTLLTLCAAYGKVCWYCGVKFSSFKEVHIDHIVPKCRGGRSHISNYALACAFCNRAKWDNTVEDFMAWLKGTKVSVEAVKKIATYPEAQFADFAVELQKGLRKPSARRPARKTPYKRFEVTRYSEPKHEDELVT